MAASMACTPMSRSGALRRSQVPVMPWGQREQRAAARRVLLQGESAVFACMLNVSRPPSNDAVKTAEEMRPIAPAVHAERKC